ncbi:uncharacterized protein IUM83_02079 [Phytophthora cinnamomi]|uniref:uncharacterized protein n=1 Tax=Phytophthora cinnamomi TaxID=4785 RepID=UPI0035599C12|nr:hypothetical protein IUM83_02079 [Phytophthora cinnamomi]
MSNNASNPFDRLVFPSDTKQIGMWKDLIVGHLRQKNAAMRREALVKGLVEPAFAYENLLRTSCEIPRPMDTDDAEAQRTYNWQLANLSEQDTYIRSLLNQTLPRSYMESLRVSFNDESLPVAWKRLETVLGQSNEQGMAAMIARFDEALAMDFASVGELILRVKEARNRINRQSREALNGVTMIPNQYAAMKVLALFPSLYWGNQVDYTNGGFHLDKVEALLRNVSMNKSRREIEAMQAVVVPANHARASQHLGKCKARAVERKREDECFYCEGHYNRDDLAHMKRDCPAMKKDRSLGVYRTNIFKSPTLQKPVPVAHVKGSKRPPGKGQGDARRNSERRHSDTLTPEQAKADVDALMASPPLTPGSPVVSDTPMSDDDDVADFEPTIVPVLAGKVSEAFGNIEVAAKPLKRR